MIVLDTSAAVDWLLQTEAGQRIEQRLYARQDTLHAVYLFDVQFLKSCGEWYAEGRYLTREPKRP